MRLIIMALAAGLFAMLSAASPAVAEPVERSAVIDAVRSLPPAAVAPPPSPVGAIPYVGSTWTVTAKVGIGRVTYLGALPGGCPCTFNQPSRGTITGTAPNITYRATSPGQDTFSVRTADGRIHGYSISVYP